MERERFEALVARALDELPSAFQSRLENVDVVVEDYPTSGQLSNMKLRGRGQLLGLYEGVPQTRRGRGYSMVTPDKITIFRKPIEAQCHSDEEIRWEIQRVVRHEIAHHFGTDEETLRRLEAGKLKRRHKEATP